MKKLIVCPFNGFRMKGVQSLLRYYMKNPMAFIAEGCEIFKGIIPLFLRESLPLSVNVVKMKSEGRSAFDAFTSVPFVSRDAVPAVIIVFLCVATIGSLTDLVGTYPPVNLLNIIFTLTLLASVLIGCSEFKSFPAVGTLKDAPDFVRPSLLPVFTEAKEIIHAAVFRAAGVAYLMVCTSFLERFPANLTDCFAVPHDYSSISFLHYTEGEC